MTMELTRQTDAGLSYSRRHFLHHVAASSAIALPTLGFLSHVNANAAQLRSSQKACILLWLGGGAPTIDMWDLKPGSKNGGEFKPIATKGDVQISDQLPLLAQEFDSLSIVRSMSTREADHSRGRYYMQTAYKPNPTVVHPNFGSIVSYELGEKRPQLEIPSYVSIGGGAGSAGFLGMSHAPFVVDSNGEIRDLNADGSRDSRFDQRLAMLTEVERSFMNSGRGEMPAAHRDIYGKAVRLMTSNQMRAFKVAEEDNQTKERYGTDAVGRGLLMARRLVTQGVPFVEVNFGGWDLHQNVFDTLKNQRLPVLDKALSALVADLKQRGMYDDVVVVCMGEFGRTPRINVNTGRDHWAASWSLVLGGGGLNGGIAVGETDADGTSIVGKSYLPGDVWATVAQALGIPLDREYKSKRGRPMPLADGGKPIPELLS